MTPNTSSSTEPRVALCKLLGTGLLIWFLAELALIGVGRFASEQRSVIGLVDWAVGHTWIAFLVGLVGMVVRSSRFPGALGSALAAYVIPAGMMSILGGICYAVYPDAWFLSEMLGFLFIVWLFGVFGWLWLRATPEAPAKEALARAVIPPLIGGIAVLVGVAVPTFRGNSFIYRDAFKLTLNNAVYLEGTLTADAVLEIRKPGDYSFQAMRFSYLDMMEDSDSQTDHSIGRIDWNGKAAPAAAATGSYPLKIRWEKSPPLSLPAKDEMREDYISFEVHTAADPEMVVHSIYVPLSAN